jgi:hypothetical protein
MSYDEHQAMWPQMIAALAAIDAELGLPEDGCNSLAQTLAAIRALKAKAQIAQAMARTAMAGTDEQQPLTWEQAVRSTITDPAVAERILSVPNDATAEEARELLRRPGA